MATSEGIPSSIDIEFLELNDNPYLNLTVVRLNETTEHDITLHKRTFLFYIGDSYAVAVTRVLNINMSFGALLVKLVVKLLWEVCYWSIVIICPIAFKNSFTTACTYSVLCGRIHLLCIFRK